MTPEEKAKKWVMKNLSSEVDIFQEGFSAQDVNNAYLAGYVEAKLEEADLVGKLMAREIEIEDLKLKLKDKQNDK